MKAWPNDEQTQCFACNALAKIASSQNVAIKKKIVDVEARTKHQNDIRVKKPAAYALVELVDIQCCQEVDQGEISGKRQDFSGPVMRHKK